MAADPRVRHLVDRLLDSDGTPEEVCGHCPELLPQVRDRWQRVRRLRGDLDVLFPPEGSERSGDETPPEVPGYRVEGLLGRGGMGVVYSARDLTLDRDVAVKLLQDDYPPDSPFARRFTGEARITAQLQHPGVPAVYRVGALSDGRPFLAMKLIRGRTLAAQLGERPDPAADRGRFVATFEQVCQAVGYAHAHNVIHRDLKPSNVMVGAFGEVQVMDWGLAKVVTARDRPPGPPDTAADPAAGTAIRPARGADPETLAGSLLGTPAFMPPEQATGAVDRVDARSDVFSLGGILCAVLTGRPPYVADTAEATRRLAAEARLDDAHARLSASGAEPELVALCLKCMSPEPQDRPRNAGEVAAVVEALRAAAEERARRAELERVRAAEQGKRRRVLLAASVAVVAVLLVGLSVSLWQTWRVARERDDKVKALVVEQQARELAMAALRDLTDDVVEGQMASGTQLTEENKEFLRKIIRRFESFAAFTADDAVSRAIRAEGHARVGMMRHRLGELHEAETAYHTALDLQKQLAADFPDRPAFRRYLATSHNNLGNLFQGTGRLKEAETAYITALGVQKQLAADFPDHPEFRQELAASQNDLGVLLRDTGRPREAEAAHAAALDVQKQLASDFPTRPEFRRWLARSHNDLGTLLHRTDRLKEAETAHGVALELQKELVADFPTRPEFHQELARTHNNLGVLLRGTGRLKEAETAFSTALAIRKQLAADFPIRPEFRQDLATSHNNLGNLFQGTGRLKEAEAAYGAALDLRKQLVTDFPTRPEFRQELATSHNNLGNLLRGTGRLEDAEAAFSVALDLRKQLAIDFPNSPEFRRELAMSHNSLGVLLRSTGRPREAEASHQAALAIRKQLVADFPDQADLRNEFAGTCVNLAVYCIQGRDFQAAKGYLEEARPHHQAALKANPRHPSYRQFHRNSLVASARANAGLLDQVSAVRAAETIRDLGWDPPGNAYDAAVAMAQCIPITAKHGELDATQREAAATFYGDAAVKFLRDAAGKGYKNVSQLKNYTDFDPLRQRDDFRTLVAEMEGK